MCAAVDSVDAVGERESRLVEAIVVLERDLDHRAFDGALHVERVVVGVAVLVESHYERADAALEVVGEAAVYALVDELDPDALREEGHLAEALHERVEVEGCVFEDIGVRQEPGGGARLLFAVGRRLERALGLAALVHLAVGLAVAAHLHPHL